MLGIIGLLSALIPVNALAETVEAVAQDTASTTTTVAPATETVATTTTTSEDLAAGDSTADTQDIEAPALEAPVTLPVTAPAVDTTTGTSASTADSATGASAPETKPTTQPAAATNNAAAAVYDPSCEERTGLTVTVEPTHGLPGTVVTVTGHMDRAFADPLVTWDGTMKGSVTTITVPADATVGDHTVAIQTVDTAYAQFCHFAASTTFTVDAPSSDDGNAGGDQYGDDDTGGQTDPGDGNAGGDQYTIGTGTNNGTGDQTVTTADEQPVVSVLPSTG